MVAAFDTLLSGVSVVTAGQLRKARSESVRQAPARSWVISSIRLDAEGWIRVGAAP
jgi:hypothetical protein